MRTYEKLVLFDIHNVLVSMTESDRYFMQFLGTHDHIAYLDHWKKYERSLCDSSLTLLDFCQLFNPHVDREPYEVWSAYLQPIIRAQTLLLELTKQGIHVGILTNNFIDINTYYIQSGRIPNVGYTHIIESYKIRRTKPSSEIFVYAQQITGRKPNELMLIDDSPRNIEAARGAGWQAVLYDESDDMFERKVHELLHL